MELDVEVAVLEGPLVLRHALVLDAFPGVWLDDLPRSTADLELAVVQVLDGEAGATQRLRQRDFLRSPPLTTVRCFMIF